MKTWTKEEVLALPGERELMVKHGPMKASLTPLGECPIVRDDHGTAWTVSETEHGWCRVYVPQFSDP